jgi:hypothetical protein
VTAAGRYDVDVDAAVAWAIVLMLDPGGNMASFVATDPAGNATEVRVPAYCEPPIPLRSDGLALAADDSAGEVLALFTDRLGSAPAVPGLASCRVEYVGWPADLYPRIQHTGPGSLRRGEPIRGWIYSGSEFRTPEGTGVGTTVAELVAQYGDRLQLPDTATYVPAGSTGSSTRPDRPSRAASCAVRPTPSRGGGALGRPAGRLLRPASQQLGTLALRHVLSYLATIWL